MSLLFDQNLSRRLPELLATEFPGSRQVQFAGLSEATDIEIWNFAAANHLTIVSKDADFVLLSSRLGPPPKVICLRIGNATTTTVKILLASQAKAIQAFLTEGTQAEMTLP
jgi:predicted nuclease of predicted toxin-antitoxin system